MVHQSVPTDSVRMFLIDCCHEEWSLATSVISILDSLFPPNKKELRKVLSPLL